MPAYSVVGNTDGSYGVHFTMGENFNTQFWGSREEAQEKADESNHHFDVCEACDSDNRCHICPNL